MPLALKRLKLKTELSTWEILASRNNAAIKWDVM